MANCYIHKHNNNRDAGHEKHKRFSSIIIIYLVFWGGDSWIADESKMVQFFWVFWLLKIWDFFKFIPHSSYVNNRQYWILSYNSLFSMPMSTTGSQVHARYIHFSVFPNVTGHSTRRTKISVFFQPVFWFLMSWTIPDLDSPKISTPNSQVWGVRLKALSLGSGVKLKVKDGSKIHTGHGHLHPSCKLHCIMHLCWIFFSISTFKHRKKNRATSGKSH